MPDLHLHRVSHNPLLERTVAQTLFRLVLVSEARPAVLPMCLLELCTQKTAMAMKSVVACAFHGSFDKRGGNLYQSTER